MSDILTIAALWAMEMAAAEGLTRKTPGLRPRARRLRQTARRIRGNGSAS